MTPAATCDTQGVTPPRTNTIDSAAFAAYFEFVELSDMATASTQPMTIRNANLEDAAGIAAIYNHFIENSVATFEEESLSADDVARRIADVGARSLPYMVAANGEGIVGYAYATAWNPRSAYRHTTEISIYLSPQMLGRKIGSMLYAALFPVLEALEIHAVIAGISLPNAASVALHEKFGMRKVAEFPEVGFKFGSWVSVGYWQKEV